uniref:little elongation complex subunit 1 isoform X2 n=1 Tax=Myxine glutinosa TaxID=7769 RepID=UPI00359009FC
MFETRANHADELEAELKVTKVREKKLKENLQRAEERRTKQQQESCELRKDLQILKSQLKKSQVYFKRTEQEAQLSKAKNCCCCLNSGPIINKEKIHTLLQDLWSAVGGPDKDVIGSCTTDEGKSEVFGKVQVYKCRWSKQQRNESEASDQKLCSDVENHLLSPKTPCVRSSTSVQTVPAVTTDATLTHFNHSDSTASSHSHISSPERSPRAAGLARRRDTAAFSRAMELKDGRGGRKEGRQKKMDSDLQHLKLKTKAAHQHNEQEHDEDELLHSELQTFRFQIRDLPPVLSPLPESPDIFENSLFGDISSDSEPEKCDNDAAETPNPKQPLYPMVAKNDELRDYQMKEVVSEHIDKLCPEDHSVPPYEEEVSSSQDSKMHAVSQSYSTSVQTQPPLEGSEASQPSTRNSENYSLIVERTDKDARSTDNNQTMRSKQPHKETGIEKDYHGDLKEQRIQSSVEQKMNADATELPSKQMHSSSSQGSCTKRCENELQDHITVVPSAHEINVSLRESEPSQVSCGNSPSCDTPTLVVNATFHDRTQDNKEASVLECLLTTTYQQKDGVPQTSDCQTSSDKNRDSSVGEEVVKELEPQSIPTSEKEEIEEKSVAQVFVDVKPISELKNAESDAHVRICSPETQQRENNNPAVDTASCTSTEEEKLPGNVGAENTVKKDTAERVSALEKALKGEDKSEGSFGTLDEQPLKISETLGCVKEISPSNDELTPDNNYRDPKAKARRKERTPKEPVKMKECSVTKEDTAIKEKICNDKDQAEVEHVIVEQEQGQLKGMAPNEIVLKKANNGHAGDTRKSNESAKSGQKRQKVTSNSISKRPRDNYSGLNSTLSSVMGAVGSPPPALITPLMRTPPKPTASQPKPVSPTFLAPLSPIASPKSCLIKHVSPSSPSRTALALTTSPPLSTSSTVSVAVNISSSLPLRVLTSVPSIPQTQPSSSVLLLHETVIVPSTESSRSMTVCPKVMSPKLVPRSPTLPPSPLHNLTIDTFCKSQVSPLSNASLKTSAPTSPPPAESASPIPFSTVPETKRPSFDPPDKLDDQKKLNPPPTKCARFDASLAEDEQQIEVIPSKQLALRAFEKLSQSHLYPETVDTNTAGSEEDKNLPQLNVTEISVVKDLLAGGKAEIEDFLKLTRRSLSPSCASLPAPMLIRSCLALCRALGDAEHARLICYNLLLKGPTVLNVVARAVSAAWPNLIASPGPVARAMQAIVSLKFAPRSKEHVSALSELATSFLLAVRKSPRVTLLRSGAAGMAGEEELSAEAWELVFALQLLCAQLGWNWTHNSFIRELIWPLLAKWGKQQDGSLGGNIHVTDPSVATLLRLVGKLGILGLSLCSNNGVKNILEVLVKMLQKTSTEVVSHGVQQAAAHSVADLSPASPLLAVKALHEWAENQTASSSLTPIPVPPGLQARISELDDLCSECCEHSSIN